MGKVYLVTKVAEDGIITLCPLDHTPLYQGPAPLIARDVEPGAVVHFTLDPDDWITYTIDTPRLHDVLDLTYLGPYQTEE